MKTKVCAGLVLLVLVVPTYAEPLKAGAAKVDITPPVGHAMWGYAVRKDAPSTGVRDPLHARAVVLHVGQQSMALVGLDLGRPPTRASMARIRKKVREATGIETLFLVASHTHHGPVLELDDWPTRDNPYVRTLEEKLVNVIGDANKKLAVARLGITAIDIGFNRNRHSSRMNPPIDREMLVARIEGADGKPIAHLVHFAAHATLLPAKVREFSPDFPGFLAQHVEKDLGGICVFLQGAAGDLSPASSPQALIPDGDEREKAFGSAIGKFVVDRSRKLKCEIAEPKTLKTRERDFKFGARIDISNPLVYAAYAIAFFPKLVDFYEREYREGIRPHMTTALIDGRIGFVGVSGELFTSHAMQLKRRARLDHLFVFGYCNDYQQYFPTIEAVAEGGYGADTIVSPVEIGAGERMMDQALMDLLDLQGKIRLPKK